MKRLVQTLTKRWPEYLIESMVIIASILGAYALDNWNQNRLDRIKEQQIVFQLTEDFQANLSQLEAKIAMRNSIIHAGKSLLKMVDNPAEASVDSLYSNLSFLIMDPTFDPIDNDLIPSGNIRLLRNDRLKRLLSSWSSEIIAVKEIEVLWRDAANDQYRPFLNRIGISRNVHDAFWRSVNNDYWLLDKGVPINLDLGQSKKSLTAQEILETHELEGFVSQAIILNYAANLESMALKKRIEEILFLLEESK